MGIAQGFIVSATFVHPEMIVPSMYYDDITFNKWPALCNMLEIHVHTVDCSQIGQKMGHICSQFTYGMNADYVPV